MKVSLFPAADRFMKTLLGPLFCLCFLTTPGWAEITSNQFLQLTKLCSPAERASGWLELDWEIDLWKARQRAAREGKPIFLWEMDGHPLGCT